MHSVFGGSVGIVIFTGSLESNLAFDGFGSVSCALIGADIQDQQILCGAFVQVLWVRTRHGVGVVPDR